MVDKTYTLDTLIVKLVELNIISSISHDESPDIIIKHDESPTIIVTNEV